MEEQKPIIDDPGKPAANPWPLMGFMGLMGAAALYLTSRFSKPVDPRFLNYVLGTHEHFVGALIAIHNGEFGRARHALATAEWFADTAFTFVPEHTIRVPDLPCLDDGTIVLRHDEDIARWRDWLRLEQSAIETKLCLRPGALLCDICGRLADRPEVRYCERCRLDACAAVASEDAVKAHLTDLIIAADLRRHEKEQAQKADAEAPDE